MTESSSGEWSADLQAEVESRGYGTSEDDLRAYGAVAGAAGGAAACSALGAPTAAPLCAEIGSYIGDVIVGWAYDVFGDDEDAEREKQEARSAAWAKWIESVKRAADSWDAAMAVRLSSFLADSPKLEKAVIPCSGGWGTTTFESWFKGQRLRVNAWNNDPELIAKFVAAAGFCFPLGKARDALNGTIMAWSPGSPNCPGVFGDYIQSQHKTCREKIQAALEDYRKAVISAQVQTLAAWGAANAVAVRQLKIVRVQLPAKENTEETISLPVMIAGGAAFTFLLSRIL